MIMRFSLCLIVVTALFLSGCSENLPAGMPKLYPVTIQVVSEGNPVENASIVFFPEDTSSRWSGGGMTDSSGNAEIKTHGKYSGSPAGRYKMLISKVEVIEKIDPKTERDLSKSYDLIDPKFGKITDPSGWVEVKPEKNKFVQEVGPAVRILQ